MNWIMLALEAHNKMLVSIFGSSETPAPLANRVTPAQWNSFRDRHNKNHGRRHPKRVSMPAAKDKGRG